VEAGGAGARVTVCDINAEMLAVGRERALQRGHDLAVSFEQGNAEELSYPDRSFDCVTIAFGIRNVPRIERALAEAYRVLKIGGRFLCLEFSSVDLPGLSSLYDVYSYNVIPRIGEAVTGDRGAYQYLVESIRKFPKPAVFAKMIEVAGFRRVSFTPMTAGVVALHSGWRL
jgi:demethylmenaquinone methyltransferase/2-methoxy-6-polyprenyl-1,4-benzoquinol methylase